MTIRTWTQYASAFRRREVEILADWLRLGSSGCVSGLPGVGMSNLLGFLCYRPEVVNEILASRSFLIHLIPIDLNNLPDESPATFYRVILRAVHESRTKLPYEQLQEEVAKQYQQYKASTDSFLVQSALWEMMQAFREKELRVVFVFDRFDDFCLTAVPHMSNTLRGLRDKFKDNLIYIMGMAQEAAYLPEPDILGRLYEILDTRVCWVWPMVKGDAWEMMQQETHQAPRPLTEADKEQIFAVSGGYPALMKAICHWWLSTDSHPAYEDWVEVLLEVTAVRHRLQKICESLNQEELLVLNQLQLSGARQLKGVTQKYRVTLAHLHEKGLCLSEADGWAIHGELLTQYLATRAGRGRGRLWWNPQTDDLMQGDKIIPDLSPLERGVMKFLLEQPRTRHTKTEIIINAWPDVNQREGVTDDSLYQIAGSLRKKIEPVPTRPVYLLTWRGNPEGGYQLYPEGRPG